MSGKLTTVLARKEAETYRSQGLHCEAIDIYTRLLARSPNIDPTLKKAVQEQIKGLVRERSAFMNLRDRPLSTEDIVRIKEGWSEQASEAERLICAQALCQVGAFSDALQEYIDLFQSGIRPEKLVEGMASCLFHLVEPDGMVRAADTLACGIVDNEKKDLAFRVLLAKTLAQQRHAAHALALFRQLVKNPAAPPSMVARLRKLLSKYDPPLTATAAAPASMQASCPPVPQSHRKGRRRLSGFLKFILRK